MFKQAKFFVMLAALLTLQTMSPGADAAKKSAKKTVPGRIIIANRTSGSLSIIDEKTDSLVKTVAVAGKFARPPEPMYVNYVAKLNRILVCDRSNNQVIALDAGNYRVIDAAPIGKGAFHMWSDGVGKQTWTVNDVDKSFTVINPKTMKVLKTIPIPDDLNNQGGKPHDIILDKKGKFAFATIVGVGGTTDFDYVIQYSTKTFKEVARRAVGKDPHVGILNNGKLLFVPTQHANTVYVMNPAKQLELVKTIEVPGAHGAGWTPDDRYFYTSNLPGAALTDGNKDSLWAIDTKTLEIASSSPFPDAPGLKVAHNIAINGDGSKLYLTHSGHNDGDAAGDVSIYNISGTNGKPELLTIVPVGINPFGIYYVPGK